MDSPLGEKVRLERTVSEVRTELLNSLLMGTPGQAKTFALGFSQLFIVFLTSEK